MISEYILQRLFPKWYAKREATIDRYFEEEAFKELLRNAPVEEVNGTDEMEAAYHQAAEEKHPPQRVALEEVYAFMTKRGFGHLLIEEYHHHFPAPSVLTYRGEELPLFVNAFERINGGLRLTHLIKAKDSSFITTPGNAALITGTVEVPIEGEQ